MLQLDSVDDGISSSKHVSGARVYPINKDIEEGKEYSKMAKVVTRNVECIDIYNSVPGLSNEISISVWESLNSSLQALLILKVQNIIPEGVSEALWSLLDDNEKKKIKDCYNVEEREEVDLVRIMKRPEEVAPHLWKYLDPQTKTKINSKKYKLKPFGFDQELWDELDDNCLKSIGNSLEEHKKTKVNNKDAGLRQRFLSFFNKRSRVLSFFFSRNYAIEDPNTGIGALVTICALVLTIPFGTFQTLSGDFFQSIKDALDACPGATLNGRTYHAIFKDIIHALAGTIYSSIMGLIISSVYYVFQPLPGKDMDRWCRRQGRFLFISLFLLTQISVIYLLVLSYSLLQFYSVRVNDLCDYSVVRIFFPGVAMIVCSLIIGLVCMA